VIPAPGAIGVMDVGTPRSDGEAPSLLDAGTEARQPGNGVRMVSRPEVSDDFRSQWR
jgi:hypothetical protein